MIKKKMNILLSFEDNDWNYTRHVAVTILSLLETNKKHKIKIYILTSSLSKENINELKRIVDSYHQEIEFIIRDDIVPEKLKKVIINKREWIRWPWYRWFFSSFIKNIDRILYMDCDVLIMKDISEIYNMNMHWKTIAWWYVTYPFNYKTKLYWINQYFNSGVLLFDAKKYDANNITVKKMEEINKKYSKYYMWWDEEKMNILLNNDIYITKQWMNYQINSKRFNRWLDDAEIIHCLQKPYKQYCSLPKNIINLYNYYLNLTKWKWFPKEEVKYWYLRHIFNNTKEFCYLLFINLMWDKLKEKYALWKFSKLYK